MPETRLTCAYTAYQATKAHSCTLYIDRALIMSPAQASVQQPSAHQQPFEKHSAALGGGSCLEPAEPAVPAETDAGHQLAWLNQPAVVPAHTKGLSMCSKLRMRQNCSLNCPELHSQHILEQQCSERLGFAGICAIWTTRLPSHSHAQ